MTGIQSDANSYNSAYSVAIQIEDWSKEGQEQIDSRALAGFKSRKLYFAMQDFVGKIHLTCAILE